MELLKPLKKVRALMQQFLSCRNFSSNRFLLKHTVNVSCCNKRKHSHCFWILSNHLKPSRNSLKYSQVALTTACGPFQFKITRLISCSNTKKRLGNSLERIFLYKSGEIALSPCRLHLLRCRVTFLTRAIFQFRVFCQKAVESRCFWPRVWRH